jgi:hypothetical protein
MRDPEGCYGRATCPDCGSRTFCELVRYIGRGTSWTSPKAPESIARTCDRCALVFTMTRKSGEIVGAMGDSGPPPSAMGGVGYCPV